MVYLSIKISAKLFFKAYFMKHSSERNFWLSKAKYFVQGNIFSTETAAGAIGSIVLIA